ncbi:MAG TPA: 3-isopropylmalate dehydratase small subunit [Terriglobales bacterium]|nr:3-isopropylmalate dehydratase small subunit [Terriglobales bacterium]
MQPFRVHKGLAIPLDRANVDTDQIVPKQFLKRIERTGFGKFLFHDWRYTPDGEPNPEFILNHPRYQGASVLIAAKNFGCGSSREHAPWALVDYGIRIIIAPSFADIFAHNSFKNGLLTVTLPDPEIYKLMRRAREVEGYHVTVDLEAGHVYDDMGFHAAFEFDDHKRRCLLEGLDEIGLTLEQEEAITAYEKRHFGR